MHPIIIRLIPVLWTVATFFARIMMHIAGVLIAWVALLIIDKAAAKGADYLEGKRKARHRDVADHAKAAEAEVVDVDFTEKRA